MNALSKEAVELFLKSSELKLKPRQLKLSFPILQRIHYKMSLGVMFKDILVAGDLIIDGHHRYICSQMLQINMGETVWAASPDALKHEWSHVVIDEMDYDSKERVNQYNLEDAQQSGLSLDYFNRS